MSASRPRPTRAAVIGSGFGGLAVAIRSESLYMGTQFLFLFWMMGVATSGLKALSGIGLPRCFLSLISSFMLTVFFLFSLYFMKLIPMEMLKASMAI